VTESTTAVDVNVVGNRSDNRPIPNLHGSSEVIKRKTPVTVADIATTYHRCLEFAVWTGI
jgi:hypothetical protein